MKVTTKGGVPLLSRDTLAADLFLFLDMKSSSLSVRESNVSFASTLCRDWISLPRVSRRAVIMSLTFAVNALGSISLRDWTLMGGISLLAPNARSFFNILLSSNMRRLQYLSAMIIWLCELLWVPISAGALLAAARARSIQMAMRILLCFATTAAQRPASRINVPGTMV